MDIYLKSNIHTQFITKAIYCIFVICYYIEFNIMNIIIVPALALLMYIMC